MMLAVICLLAPPPAPAAHLVAITAERLAAVPGMHCAAPRPSPDGRWLAYEVDEKKGVRRQMLLALDTREARRVMPLPEAGGARAKLAEAMGRPAGGQVC